mmetsp:Transcript_21772/g.55572  ORF Transcript_21772/g.55572 Transcript_21772/m.55572 type:complete len:81 (-) Transcript_21772:801-1043(-)
MWPWSFKWSPERSRDDKTIVAAEKIARACSVRPPTGCQPVELGTIAYVNIEQNHGSLETALSMAAETGKPIFANFVEWPG